MAESTQIERKVTVWSTKSGEKAYIHTDATNWKTLKSLINDQGFNMRNMDAAEGHTNVDFVNDLAELPEGDFIVFLRPKKVKAGATRKQIEKMDYKALKAEVKRRMGLKKDGEAFKAHMNKEINWTRQKGDVLRDNLFAWIDGTGTSTSVKEEPKTTKIKATKKPKAKKAATKKSSTTKKTPKKKVTKKAAPVVEEVEVTETVTVTESGPEANQDVVDFMQAQLDAMKDKDFCGQVNSYSCEAYERAVKSLEEAIKFSSDEEAGRLDEEKRLDEEENKMLAQMAKQAGYR